MKKTISIQITLWAGLISSVLPLLCFADALDDQMIQYTKIWNQRTPQMVDESIRWDSVTYSNRTLFYKYAFINQTSIDSNKEQKKTLTQLGKDKIATLACTNTPDILNSGITMQYSYYGTDNKIISEFNVTSKDCLNNENTSTIKEEKSQKVKKNHIVSTKTLPPTSLSTDSSQAPLTQTPIPPSESTITGKLKKGMTREQVIAVFGEPINVEERSTGPGMDTWDQWMFRGSFCQNNLCFVHFHYKTHEVVHWSDFKPQYTDYLGN